MKWMYDVDPFAARRADDERQAKAAQNRQQGSSKDSATQASREFAHAPEVKMAVQLREMVEDVVKKVIESIVEGTNIDPSHREMHFTLVTIL